MMQEDFWLFLFADDFDFLCSGPRATVNLCFALFVLELAGTPLTWKKISGGFEYEWIGYWQNLKEHKIGISQARTTWLRQWAENLTVAPVAQVRAVVEGLGRLGYSMTA
eukprot:12199992-Karenia_brevis.AAC.1